MPTQVQSPISRPCSRPPQPKRPLTPGANTTPGGSNFHRGTSDSVPPQPPHGASSRHSEETKEEPLCRS
jgi:hypothetical protein